MSSQKKNVVHGQHLTYIYKNIFYLYLWPTGGWFINWRFATIVSCTCLPLTCYLDLIWVRELGRFKKKKKSRFWSADLWEIWIIGRSVPFQAVWQAQFSRFYVSMSRSYLKLFSSQVFSNISLQHLPRWLRKHQKQIKAVVIFPVHHTINASGICLAFNIKRKPAAIITIDICYQYVELLTHLPVMSKHLKV